MTNRSLPQPAELVEAVEAYISELPEKRRRKRTRAEINAGYDITPELENYGPEPEPTITIELDGVAQAVLPVLLGQLGEARSTAMVQLVTAKIYQLLGLELEDK